MTKINLYFWCSQDLPYPLSDSFWVHTRLGNPVGRLWIHWPDQSTPNHLFSVFLSTYTLTCRSWKMSVNSEFKNLTISNTNYVYYIEFRFCFVIIFMTFWCKINTHDLFLYTCEPTPKIHGVTSLIVGLNIIYLHSLFLLAVYALVWLKDSANIVSDHNHKPQTNPWHREEEPHNHHETPGRQTK